MEQIRRSFTHKEFSMGQHSKSRVLVWLANAKLILIQSESGCSPIITILPLRSLKHAHSWLKTSRWVFKMHPITLQCKAKAGEIPGAKPGKAGSLLMRIWPITSVRSTLTRQTDSFTKWRDKMLFKRNEIWYYKFTISGKTLYRSTGTSDKSKAQEIADKVKAKTWDQLKGGENKPILARSSRQIPAGSR